MPRGTPAARPRPALPPPWLLLLLGVSAPVATLGQPGDVFADPLEKVLEGASQDALGVAANVGEAAIRIGSQDPGAVVGGALDVAENAIGGVVPGRAVISDAVEIAAGEVGLPLQPPGGIPTLDVRGSPESPESLAGYEAAQSTPAPAVLGGVFCRGGACRFRRPEAAVRPPGAAAAAATTAAAAVGAAAVAAADQEEPTGRGFDLVPPPDVPAARFTFNCGHLLGDRGSDALGSVGDARDAFEAACEQRVELAEASACGRYADVIAAALAPKLQEPTVGSMQEVCADVYQYIKMIKQAEIDFRLIAAALPERGPKPSMLAQAPGVRRSGAGDVGPSSPRGRRWRAWWTRRHPQLASSTEGGAAAAGGGVGSFLRGGAGGCDGPSGGDGGGDGAEGPEYSANAPCAYGYNAVPQANTKYQISPATSDATAQPVEVGGALWMYCVDQMGEIDQGFPRTAPRTVQMVEDWCRWQASVTTWVGADEEWGHPDWNGRTCNGVAALVSFALRGDLGSRASVRAPEVCKKLFFTIGTVHRVDQIVRDAWAVPERGGRPRGPEPPSAKDPEVRQLLQDTRLREKAAYARLRTEKEAYDAASAAKKEVAAYNHEDAASGAPVSLLAAARSLRLERRRVAGLGASAG